MGFIEREYKKVQKKLTIFHILTKNELDNILYQYLQKSSQNVTM